MAKKRTKIAVDMAGDFMVIRLLVRSVLDRAEAEKVLQEMEEAVQVNSAKVVVLDFGGMKYMSSLFLGKLVRFQQFAREWQMQIRVCGLGKDSLKAFKMVGLHKLIPCYKDVLEALKH